MIYTYSGHRNAPGQKGLELNHSVYSKIDRIYGPSSWTVKWSLRNGILYADEIEIGGLETVLTKDNRTVKEVLLSKPNIIANIGEKCWRGFSCNYKTAAERGFGDVALYLERENISISYENSTSSNGWWGIKVSIDKEDFEEAFCWPYTKSEKVDSIFNKLDQLIDPTKLDLVL